MSTPRLQQLLHLLTESPEDSFLTFAVAKEYEGAGDDEQARDYYLRLVENDPAYVGVYYHLGKLYERQGAIRDAFRTYRQGIDAARRAGDQHALSELAGAKLALGDEEDFD